MKIAKSFIRFFKAHGELLQPYLKWSPLWLLLAILTSLAILGQSYFLGLIIDSLTKVAESPGSANISASLELFIVASIVFIVSEGLLGIYTMKSWNISNSISTAQTYRALQEIMRKDTQLFEGQKLGELQKKIHQYWEASFAIIHSIIRRFTLIVIDITLVLSIGFYLNWRLTLVLLSFVPVVIVLGFFTTKVAHKQQKQMTKLYSKQSGMVSDALQNIKTVKAFVMESRFLRRLDSSLRELELRQNKLNGLWALSDVLGGSVFAFSRLIIIGIGVWFIAAGWATIGSLIMFAGFAGQFLGSIRFAFNEMPNLVRNISSFEETQDIVDKPVYIKNADKPIRPRSLNGNITLKNISFAYGKKKVLRKVTLEIPENKTTAIVGFSGAGKSTLIKLLMRYIDANEGQIMIGENEIRDIDIKTLRQKTGLVLQENVLFNESVLENIRIGRVSATKEEVIEAAKKAQAHDFIEKLPKGYKTKVGDRGVKLSGGERQRIAIARIFLENPDILILDEATSALDSKTEHDLQLALEEVTKNRTSVIIAHRLSTIMKADQIVVMDRGRVVDIGTHEELIKRDGQYKTFWNIQAGGYS